MMSYRELFDPRTLIYSTVPLICFQVCGKPCSASRNRDKGECEEDSQLDEEEVGKSGNHPGILFIEQWRR
jgi:hypothetical protein